MQTSFFLSERTANDIDSRVAKVLRDVGITEPPLSLADVRHLLELDLNWYSSADEGILHETIHRMTIAGKQILARPCILLDAVRKFSLKALWQPDRKRILLDHNEPKLKHRWNEAHEIGHSLLDWHEPYSHGDHKQTLSYSCHQQIEAEANYAAGRMLFLRDRFTEELFSSPITFAAVQALSKSFGNTITSCLWRTIESIETPCFAMVSLHPRDQVQPNDEPVRHFIRSRQFAKQFDGITANQVFGTLATFCRRGGGPIGEAEIALTNDNGAIRFFTAQSFHNGHDTLTLAMPVGVREPAVALVK